MHTNAEVDDQQYGVKVSYTPAASVHDMLERFVWTEPPTDLRLNDGRCWQPVKALLLSSRGVSVRWSSGSTHMTTDAKHVENLAGLPAITSLMPKWSASCEIRNVPRSCGSRLVFSVRASPRTARATWIDGAWSGDSVSCKPLFAGAGRLKNHAIDAPRVSRRETSHCRWKQDRDTDENSETCREWQSTRLQDSSRTRPSR